MTRPRRASLWMRLGPLLVRSFCPALLALALAGCNPGCGSKATSANGDARAACAASRPALVEVRDGQGALQLALRPPREAAPADEIGVLCDGSARLLGTLAGSPDGLAVRDAAGAGAARIEGPPRRDGASGDGEDARLVRTAGGVRLHESGALLRLLDDQGVPLGQVERQPAGPDGTPPTRAIAFDGAGRGLATAERVEKQDESRLAVRAPDGTTRFILLGLRRERAAATFALEALPLVERLLLARWLETH